MKIKRKNMCVEKVVRIDLYGNVHYYGCGDSLPISFSDALVLFNYGHVFVKGDLYKLCYAQKNIP